MAGNLLRLHSKELGLIRSTSGTYREMVLRNYTYMRNQSKSSFWSDKLSKRMALVFSQNLYTTNSRGAGSQGTGSGNTQTGSSNQNYCDTCKQIHQGRPGAAPPFSMANHTKLGQDLPRPRARPASVGQRCQGF